MLSLAGAALALLVSSSPPVPGKISVYTTREPGLIRPLLDAFSKETGVVVETVFVKEGLLERVKAEGARSPADVLMTVDAGNLLDLVDAQLTQPLSSEALSAAIPANLRDPSGHWFALSLRARVLYADKSLALDRVTYEELADPKWKSKVCVRAGQHPYNIALIAAKIAHDGVGPTEKWLTGLKANLARKPTGGDRDVARDILGAICDVGLANSYYVGHMLASAPGTDARKWGEAIKVIKPVFAAKGGGTHVNVSGAAVAKHAPNAAGARRLLEYLVSETAQKLYAQANYEYPVRKGVALDPTIARTIGALEVDPISLVDIAKHRKAASELVDRVGFDK